MLEDLTIKDFALIDSVSIEFPRGFTVLSGETGAGKSILIGALSCLIGGKSDAPIIRSPPHEAAVSGTFLLGNGKNEGGKNDVPKVLQTSLAGEEEDATAEAWLLQHGIESDDGRVLVRRTLRDSGKSSAWIQSTPVTRADLASFSALLVDIHGQHDHQSLMRVVQHRVFLDARAGITEDVRRFTALYAELVEKRKRLDELNASSEERERKIEMYSFAVHEINEAKLKADEDVLLAEEEGRLSSYEKLASDIDTIVNMLSDNETSAVSILKQVRRDASHALEMDKTLSDLDSRVESAFYEVSDIADEFSAYKDKLVYDPARFAEVQERLSLIYNLKKKYASSPSAPLSEVLQYAAEAEENLERLGAGKTDKASLEKEALEAERRVYTAAKALS